MFADQFKSNVVVLGGLSAEEQVGGRYVQKNDRILGI